MECRVSFILFFVAVQYVFFGIAMRYSGEGSSNIRSTTEQAGVDDDVPVAVGTAGTINSRGIFRRPLFRETPTRSSSFSGGVEQVAGSSSTDAVGSGFDELPLTVIVNSYVTLTDFALRTVPVTLTQLVVHTKTRRIEQVVSTPVDDIVAISTSVVVRPTFVTVRETKSDFRMVTITSLTRVTQTLTSYNIRHVTFTTTVTQVVSITSGMGRTVVSTHRDTVTNFHTVLNTVYVH